MSQVTLNKVENDWHSFWNVSVTAVEGDNIFSPVYATPEFIIFSCHNVNRTGRTTNLIYAVGKNGSGFSDIVREVSPCK